MYIKLLATLLFLSIRAFINIYITLDTFKGYWRYSSRTMYVSFLTFTIFYAAYVLIYAKTLTLSILYIHILGNVLLLWYFITANARIKMLYALFLIHVIIIGQTLSAVLAKELMQQPDYKLQFVFSTVWALLYLYPLLKIARKYSKRLIESKYKGIIDIANIIMLTNTIALITMQYLIDPYSWGLFWARLFSIIPALMFFHFVASLLTEIEVNEKINLKISVLEQIRYLEKNYFDFVIKTWQDSRRVRHDMRHVSVLMLQYLENKQFDKLATCLKQFNEDIDKTINIKLCGNEIIDGIIGYWQLQSAELHIRFNSSIEIDKVNINDIDLSIMLGNILENAFYAAAAPATLDKFIDIKIITQANMLLVSISNSYSGDIVKNNGKFYSIKRNFKDIGIGIESVQQLVDKYNGYISFNDDAQNHVFKVNLAVVNAKDSVKE